MAAAEKFKAPEQPTVEGETQPATVEPLHESDEEEVTDRPTAYLLIKRIVVSCIHNCRK